MPVVVGVIVLLGVVAVIASSGGDGGDASDTPGLEQTQPVRVTGDPLPQLGDGATDAAVGDAAPELAGSGFTGIGLRIEADGTPKVLVFLAHWCPHCQREVPHLADWTAENGRPQDVDVYGISTSVDSDRPNFPPSRWLEREEWPFPVLADDETNTAARAFGLSSFPFFVVLDGGHRVVARGSGELDDARWEALLDAARRGDA